MNKSVLVLFIFLSSGCSTWQGITASEAVKPWERDILAQDGMQFPSDKMQAFTDDHIYFSKEASTGGNGVGGGGCGCN
jgi:hypothetical protein